MEPFHCLEPFEQVAGHLRQHLLKCGSDGKLPGLVRLATQLGVSKTTMRKAMRLLEEEGLVAVAEDGLSRLVTRKAVAEKPAWRIGYLLFESLERENTKTQEVVLSTQRELERAGFRCFLSTVSQCGLRNDVGRISRYVRNTQADAWVVNSGSSGLLEWFVEQKVPALALAGGRHSHAIAAAAPDFSTSVSTAILRLIELGHRKIVCICRKSMRIPEPGYAMKSFLNELHRHGIPTSNYNLPDWEETPEGFEALLKAMFQVTPPTALIVFDVMLVPAVMQFLAYRKIGIPSEVSLVVADEDPSFPWCRPSLAHISWESAAIVKRVVEWVNAISRGREDIRQVVCPSEFVEGGTIGPVRKR